MDRTTMARTESAFREVNEAIAAAATRLEADAADFLCECGDPSCAHRVTTDLETYERVRAHATHFLLAPGHEQLSMERVVERRPRYEVVEKLGRTVVQVVRRLDPRRRGAAGSN